ncbi:MAG TPA: hypothetical protein VK811_07035 [Candidatus Acidoferrum sp.]|jgi:hypothetical protein|nr:hypothetical protein [Candidatus Acidoferrum sp.]
MKTLSEYGFHGEKPLEEILSGSIYGCVGQAVASLTVFTHPNTAVQTRNKGIFRVRRYRAGEKRGQIIEAERVVVCDNMSTAHSFCWANNLDWKQFKECQYNHIYAKSYDPIYYTSLANICVTPAFLGKLTDKNKNVRQLLCYRAFELYAFHPNDEPEPIKPEGYDGLKWAPPLPAILDVKGQIIRRFESHKKSRAAISKNLFGWVFDGIS